MASSESPEMSRAVLIQYLATYVRNKKQDNTLYRVVIKGPHDLAFALRDELTPVVNLVSPSASVDTVTIEISDVLEPVSPQGSLIYLAQESQKQNADDIDNRNRANVVIDITVPSHPRVLKPNEGRKPTLKGGLRVRFKRPKIPIRVWIIQVVLFFVTSLMNNLAFGYNVTLGVQIIFRSGGPAANVFLGYLRGKRYTLGQVLSVLLITAGVAAATLSAKMESKKPMAHRILVSDQTPVSTGSYMVGILLLAVALLLSAAMGLAQEDAYNHYGRGHWEEGLFYLHFLSLPMFSFTADTLIKQIKVANSSPRMDVSFASAVQQAKFAATNAFFLPMPPIAPHPILTAPRILWVLEKAYAWLDRLPSFSVPRFWIPLITNALTHLVCVAGVHRLTSQVSSLTVTVVLAVRKAVSLGISMIFVQGNAGSPWLWGGAAAVLLGTIIYSVENRRQWESKTIESIEASKKEL